jgi:hypothetical protein
VQAGHAAWYALYGDLPPVTEGDPILDGVVAVPDIEPHRESHERGGADEIRVDIEQIEGAGAAGATMILTRSGWQLPGGGAAQVYEHEQVTPSATWVIEHGLAYDPNVTLIDSTGAEFWADHVLHEAGVVTVTLSGATGGRATCT